MPSVYCGDIFYVENRIDVNPVGSEMWHGRPAVVVSNNDHNCNSDTVAIVYLTLREKSSSPMHVPVQCKTESTALCEQLATISKERLGTYVRRCTEAEMRGIRNGIAHYLGMKNCEEAKTPELAHVANDGELSAVCAERDVYKRMYEQLLEHMFVK